MYSPLVPPSEDSPSIDAVKIQTNFDQFAAIFNRLVGAVNYNHTAFNDPHQGKHGAIIIQNRVGDPGVIDDLAILYSKDAAAATGGPQPQLFAQILKFLPTNLDTRDAPNIGMQLTYNTVNTAGPIYQSFLPGGYIIYFGSITGANAPATITLVPTPTKTLMAQAFPTTTQSVNGPPDRVFASITQPDKVIVNSSTASPADVFLWLAIAQA